MEGKREGGREGGDTDQLTLDTHTHDGGGRVYMYIHVHTLCTYLHMLTDTEWNGD